jgi:hypothetical protein
LLFAEKILYLTLNRISPEAKQGGGKSCTVQQSRRAGSELIIMPGISPAKTALALYGDHIMNDDVVPSKSYSVDDLREEERKIRHLRRLVDFVAMVIARADISLLEACNLIRLTRQQALSLFPDKERIFELVHRPRFARIIRERLASSPSWMN